MDGYKFDSKRYGTIGFRDNIPEQVQLLIWEMLDKKLQEHGVLDYLQIFTLPKRYGRVQEIQHEQEEVNPFCYSESFPLAEAVECKVYVIDSPEEGAVVAMLGEEY